MSHTGDTYDIARVLLSNHGGVEINSLNHAMNCINTQDVNDDHIITEPILDSFYYTHEQFNNFQIQNGSKFKVLSINCQSLNSKYNELKCILDHCMEIGSPVQALVVQETHIQENQHHACLDINGYNLISQPAIINRCGGLAIYLHEQFTYEQVLCDVTSTLFESQFIKIKVNRFHSLIIGNVYRRPDDNYNSYTLFNEQISNVLDKLNNCKCDVMLAGDFNINLLKIGIRPVFSEFLELILSAGFLPQITLPTRFSNNNTFSLIDNFFTKFTATTSTQVSGILASSVSDHFGYFTALEYNLPKQKNKYIHIRKENEVNITNCVNHLSHVNLTNMIHCGDMDDPNSNYDIIHNEIKHALDKNMPVNKVKFNKYKHFKEKWMTKGILRSINTRNALYIELKSLKIDHPLFEHSKNHHDIYNKLLKKVIRRAKRKHYSDFFHSNSNNMKKTWKEINLLIGKKRNNNNPDFFIFENRRLIKDFDIAEGFNKYFSEIGTSISESMTSHNDNNYKKYLTNPTNLRFDFTPVTEKEVLDTLNTLSNKSSYGHDNLSTNLLKKIFSPLLKPLTIVINQSLRTGIFPSTLKIAKLIPLYKKDDPHSFGNYRPIALLPAISKLFEKILHSQVSDYFETNKLLYAGQYGFRSGHSCELAALELIDRASDLLVNKKDPFSVFLDLSKAFDTLSHDILVEKLKYYCFNPQATKLIESYLCQRKQYVHYNEVNSNLIDIKIGVPQGSILGPLLFLIYINDMHRSSKMFKFINFADDTTLLGNLESFCSNRTPAETAEYINNELKFVENWLSSNKLSLNAKKTKVMFFKSINRRLIPPKLELCNSPIEVVNKFCFLGIILDEKLKWSDHVKHITIKISRANGILNRLKHFIPQSTLLKIYHAIISPHLNYGILLWGYNCANVIKIQKKSLRIINDTKFNSHTEPLFKKNKIIKVEDLTLFRLLIFNHRMINHKVPSFFSSFRTENQYEIHNYYTRGHNRPALLRSAANYQTNTLRFQLNKCLIITPIHLTVNVNALSELNYKCRLKQYINNSYSEVCSISNCYVCHNR